MKLIKSQQTNRNTAENLNSENEIIKRELKKSNNTCSKILVLRSSTSIRERIKDYNRQLNFDLRINKWLKLKVQKKGRATGGEKIKYLVTYYLKFIQIKMDL